MQLGLYRTTFVAARLYSLSQVSSFIIKMTNRGMKSSPGSNSMNCRNKLDAEDDEGRPQHLGHKSKVYEDEFPSLSASISSMPKNKRRKDVENISPLQLEESTSISHLTDLGLPTSFGKKPSRSRKPSHSHHENGEAKRSSMLSPGVNIDEPFDICFPKATRQLSYENEKNSGMWVPKLQSAELNVDMKSNAEILVEESGQVLRPGMVLFKRYIPLSEQVEIVKRCRELGYGIGGFYRPGYNDGAKLRLNMMCLGLDWNPQTKRYGEKRQHDNATPPYIPREFASLVNRVLHDSHTLIERDSKITNVEDILPCMSPDVCIVNFYATNGRLGLHQDRDESQESLWKGLPVVSLSIGDSAEFLYGDSRDVEKAERVILESGDVLIFGGESRLIFHGVTTILTKTAPHSLLKRSKLKPGRLNLTFRKY